MIAVSAAAIVLVLRPNSGGNDNETPSATEHSEFASANDTGPANLITEEPTCEAWGRIAGDYVAATKSVNWTEHDIHRPASEWTPEQRSMYETVGKAMTDAADLVPNLQKQTPHRVVRELYGQFAVYAQEFVKAIPSYEYESNFLANVASATLSGLAAICSAVDYKSVQSLAPLVSVPDRPSKLPEISDSNDRFVTAEDSTCAEWIASTDRYDDETAAWVAVDPKIAANEWSPEQTSIYDAVAPVMTTRADEMERMGRQSGNPVFEDIAVLSAQYMRAYVRAIPKYTSRDNFLSDAATYMGSAIYSACKAVS